MNTARLVLTSPPKFDMSYNKSNFLKNSTTRSDCRGNEEVDGNPGRTATVQIRTIDGTDSERFKLLHIMRLY